MASAIEPEGCQNTGRLLTEWFEYPEYDDAQLEQLACEHYGLAVEDRPRITPGKPLENPEAEHLGRKINAFISARKNRRWRSNMTQQEVAARMNEATKMVSPDNFKFLPDNVRERTGLEVNPLWLMECLVRSGVLTPKEQIGALKELAGYTHSKAPNISHSTHTEMSAEDWLEALAEEEYKTVEHDENNPIVQPMQRVEAGAGKNYAKRRKQKISEISSYEDFGRERLAAFEAEFEMVPDEEEGEDGQD